MTDVDLQVIRYKLRQSREHGCQMAALLTLDEAEGLFERLVEVEERMYVLKSPSYENALSRWIERVEKLSQALQYIADDTHPLPPSAEGMRKRARAALAAHGTGMPC